MNCNREGEHYRTRTSSLIFLYTNEGGMAEQLHFDCVIGKVWRVGWGPKIQSFVATTIRLLFFSKFTKEIFNVYGEGHSQHVT